jgi:hypothetical protein
MTAYVAILLSMLTLSFHCQGLGCVCGVTHDQNVRVFWIQCDVCSSWYNVADDCVEFTESHAKTLKRWICWGCPLPNDEPENPLSLDSPESVFRYETNGRFDAQQNMDKARQPQKSQCALDSLNKSTRTKVERNVDKASDFEKLFEKGELVFVEEHAWSGVNNSEGVASITRAYIDEDGDQVYDIKYVVGGSKRGVLPQYLNRHTFG